MARDSGSSIWTYVVIAIAAYLAWRFYTGFIGAGSLAYAAGNVTGGALDFSQPSYIPPSGGATTSETGSSVLDQYLAAQLAQSTSIQQQLTDIALKNLANLYGQGGSGTSGGSASGTSGGSASGTSVGGGTSGGTTAPAAPPNVSALLQQLQANSQAYLRTRNTQLQAQLHQQNQDIRNTLAELGYGTLSYNPRLRYSQLVVNGVAY